MTDRPEANDPISLLGALARTGTELNSTRYRIDKEVGRGATGAVLQVFDPGLRRQLAMKVLRDDGGQDAQRPVALARFLEEAQVTAQLDHPGIVPVHEVGLDDQKRLYFTMRLVKGRDLRTILDLAQRGEEGWTPTGAVGVLLKVCEAMAFAHDKGVVHRDLKPANVMVGKYGEVYVMDWGLAQVAGHEDLRDLHLRPIDPGTLTNIRTDRGELRASEDNSPLVTMDGTVLGTPYYMPPEQAAGRILEIGPHSDVYAVGAMLYHLLAGAPPYHAPGDRTSVHTVLAMVMQGPPRSLRPTSTATPELIAICERAMARTIAARYPTMGALANDLRAYLEGRVVRAYETGAVAEFRKWVKRNRGMAGAIAAALLFSIAGLASTAYVQAMRRHEQLVLSRELAKKNAALELANGDLSRARDAAVNSAQNAEAQASEAARQRDAANRVAAFLENLFETPDPERAQGKEVTARDLLMRGAIAIARDDLDPLVQARLRETIGGAYYGLGRYDEAEPLYRQALDAYTRLLGEGELEMIRICNRLAMNYQLLERYQDAQPLYERALELARRYRGDDDQETRSTLSNLASLYAAQDRYAQAEPLIKQALEANRRVFGEDHPATLTDTNNLASLLLRQGRMSEAEPLLKRCYEGFQRASGKDHPITLTSANNLAYALLEQARYDEAAPILEQTLEDCERVFGLDHPTTMVVTHNLGRVYQGQGLSEEALPLFERALEGRRRALGTEHRDTQSSLEWTARACLATNRLERAEQLAREVLSLTEPNRTRYPERQALLEKILAARR
ncbi:MAG: serine/threonine-protein kinase [Planctomycetota bacterium]